MPPTDPEYSTLRSPIHLIQIHSIIFIGLIGPIIYPFQVASLFFSPDVDLTSNQRSYIEIAERGSGVSREGLLLYN
jgi:hypothetical protein